MVDLVHVPTDQPLRIKIGPSTAPASATATAEATMSRGLYGTLIRAIYAHAQMDIDRSNPDSNSPGPAFLSQLSSVAACVRRAGHGQEVVAEGGALPRPVARQLGPSCVPMGACSEVLAGMGAITCHCWARVHVTMLWRRYTSSAWPTRPALLGISPRPWRRWPHCSPMPPRRSPRQSPAECPMPSRYCSEGHAREACVPRQGGKWLIAIQGVV